MLKAGLLSILAISALVAAVGIGTKGASFDRLAQRVERADVIPEATRSQLRHLVEDVTQNAKVTSHDKRNATAVARIERAMQTKPAERGRMAAFK